MSKSANTAETRTESWNRRANHAGKVDFTMMYVAHDAFNRDLARLLEAFTTGRGNTTAAVATWQLFCRQLHTHHTAEDTALWPRLREVSDRAGQVVLDAMEAEHAALDPLIEQIAHARDDGDLDTASEHLANLAAGLSAHMIHEETQALPLLERTLGKGGWDSFSKEIRDRVGGMKGAAEYLPWVLDGAVPDVQRSVLGLLPPPARIIYRRVWEPKYRRADRL